MVRPVNDERRKSNPADPASHDPSQGRPDSRAYRDGGREADPSDCFMRMLHRLAEIGMDLAEDLREDRQEERAARRAAAETAQAERADDPPAEVPDPAPGVLASRRSKTRDVSDLAFHRLTRAVRLCMALSLKIHNDRLEREKQGAALQATAKRQRKARLKTQLNHLVKQAIDHQAHQERERLIESGDPAELGDEPSWNDR